MEKSGNFLSDLLGNKYNAEAINDYATKLRDNNIIPFIQFANEGLEDELLVFCPAENKNDVFESLKEAESNDATSSIMGVYEDLEYPLNKGPFFYASNYELNYSHRTYIIFTQDGLIIENPEGYREPIIYPWDYWKEVLYTKHAKIDAPVILLSPVKSNIPELSISPVLMMDKNVKTSIGSSEGTSSKVEATYSDLALAEMNFAYQSLKRFWKVVDENRHSDSNEISLETFTFLKKEDFQIFKE